MQIIEDPKIFRPLLQQAIEKYGYAPEHNADWFEYDAEPWEKAVFVSWPDGTGLMTYRDDQDSDWYTFSEPLAPRERGNDKLIEFADFVLNKFVINEVVLDTFSENYHCISEILPAHLKLSDIYYTLTWPVMNMEKFDPTLSGGHFKSLRNSRSRFLRDHCLTVISAGTVDKKILHNILNAWKINRGGNDVAWLGGYSQIIDAGFRGTDSARVIVVDDRPVGLNAGWKIPNSERFYYAISLHDYSIRDLGLMIHLENLEWLKRAGYKAADMGGGDEGGSLYFKNRFLPESNYKTVMFSVLKK